jgi:hypothetical protein
MFAWRASPSRPISPRPDPALRDEWRVRRSYISQKSVATLSDRVSEKDLSLENNEQEVELIAA